MISNCLLRQMLNNKTGLNPTKSKSNNCIVSEAMFPELTYSITTFNTFCSPLRDATLKK
jgi:hypothetical protein